MKQWVEIIIAIVGAEIVKHTGGFDTIFTSLLLLMVIDYMTGIIKSIHNKNLNSEKGYFGILKKVLMLLIIIVAQQVDLIFAEQNVELCVREATILFYICNEIISILENAGQFISIPDKIKEVLEQLKPKKKQQTTTNENNNIGRFS